MRDETVIDVTEETDRTDLADRTDLVRQGQRPLVSAETMEGIHQARAELLTTAYMDAKNAMTSAVRRVVVVGLLLLERKDELPHGEFLPWLEKYCPEIPVRSAQSWMQTATATLGLLGVSPTTKFEDGSIVDVMTLEEDLLVDSEAVDLRRDLFSLIDGSSARQLVMDYKSTQAKPHSLPPKRVETPSKEEVAKIQREQANAMASEMMRAMEVLCDQVVHMDYVILEALNDRRVDLGRKITEVMPLVKKRSQI